MRRTFVIFIFLFALRCAACAQADFAFDDDYLTYAVIKDSDGFVNVRESPNGHSAIKGKINKYCVFSCEPNKTNWWKVLYIQYDNTHHSSWMEGYIHKSRVVLLNKWTAVIKRSIFSDSCILTNDSLQIIVKKAQFNRSGHKLSKRSADDFLIDGKSFWGQDGDYPKFAISKLELKINNKSISIPKNAFDDLYEPRLETLSFTHGPQNTIYIEMANSDGAGAYIVIWIFKDGKYYTRYIDDSMV